MPTIVSRIRLIVCVVCVINLSIASSFAQELDETAVILESPALDPVAVNEQSLLLGESPAGTTQSTSGTSLWGIFRMLLTLAVVAAAIYGLVFVIKRASRNNRSQDPFLKVLASVPLGTNRGAHIISVGSQAWLVGAAENGVHLISEISDKDILDAMLLEDSRKSVFSGNDAASGNTGRFPDFRALLHKLGMPVETGAPTPESIRKRREKIKGL